MKMRTQCGKWFIVDGDRNIIFDNSQDAWLYVLLMKEVRPNPPTLPQSIYPVRTLDPRPSKVVKKKCFIEQMTH